MLCTYLQSWDQGESVWGRNGMAKLWGASNVRGLGAGLSDSTLLRLGSDLIGSYDRLNRSSSSSRYGLSTSDQTQKEAILDVSDLGALPSGREVLFCSGLRPIMCELRHYSTGPDADKVQASRAYYESQLPASRTAQTI